MMNRPQTPSFLRTKIGFIFLFMVLFLCLTILIYAQQFNFLKWDNNPTLMIARFLFFDRFINEGLILLLFALGLLNRAVLARCLFYILLTVFMLIHVIQLSAFLSGGEFLSRLALENFEHIQIILTLHHVISFILLLILCVTLIYILEKKTCYLKHLKLKLSLSIFIILCILFFQTTKFWISNDILEQREHYFLANNFSHTSPILSLYRELETTPQQNKPQLFSNQEIEQLHAYGFNFNPFAEYPFIKKKVYQKPLPFSDSKITLKKPNIIVFFTEGFSARMSNVYEPQLPEITPNLVDFSQSAMVVEHYYNHTAATYRGLLGQWCSLYPFYGGAKNWQPKKIQSRHIQYSCLPQILAKIGYHTYFFDAHEKDNAHTDEMAVSIGFDEVLTVENLKVYINNEMPTVRDSYSDVQFYRAIIGFLKANETTATKKPFFISSYSLATHAWINIVADGKPYEQGNNNALNTIHTLDYSFGLFWKYFQQSPYAKNTIVIFTTDHAHYTEKSYVDMVAYIKEKMSRPYQKIFIDQIPLIIYDPRQKLPQHYNAKYQTSLGFAASLLHLLEQPNHPNAFLGKSIFDPVKKTHLNISVLNNKNIYFIDQHQIHGEKNSKAYSNQRRLVQKIIQKQHQIELENKLWH